MFIMLQSVTFSPISETRLSFLWGNMKQMEGKKDTHEFPKKFFFNTQKIPN